MRQTRQILRRRRAHAKTVQILGAVTAHIVVRLAARLLNHNLAARAVGRRELGAPADTVVRDLAHKLLDDVHGLRDLGTTHLAAGIAVAVGSNDGLKCCQACIGAVTEHAHVVIHARGATEREKGVSVCAQVREADMVAEIAQAYAEWSGTDIAGQPSASDSHVLDNGSSAADGIAASELVIEISHLSHSYSLSARERRRWRKRSTTADASSKQALWGNDPNSPWALRDVSLTVRRGEFLGLAGHTGSGKSTLVQHLNGLIRPQEGSVCALGLDLSSKKDAAAVKAKVGVVFQYPERQLFAETVAQDVAFGPRNLGLPEDEVARRVASSLARVGLDLAAIGDKNPFELSGGQQRRVAFAGVLAMEPEVLVLDEPMAGLDPAARGDFLGLIDRLHREGLTVVMVSHNMDDLANCCDRIVVMNEGAVFAEGTPAQVFARANELKSIGLGVPAAQRMALALAQAGVPLRCDKLYTVEALADELAGLLLGCADVPLRVPCQGGSKAPTREEGC